MSTPASKRRRIDAANSALSKPFRSPFKSPLKNTHSDDTPSIQTSTPKLQARPENLLKAVLDGTPSRVRSSRPAAPSPISNAALNADPDIAPLLLSQRQLEKTLRALKEELEVAEQARKIELESEKFCKGGEIDGELVALIRKWKGASRLAADELFGGARDKINRMGGPKAWKDMQAEAQKRQLEFQNQWDEEPRPGADDEEDEGGDGEKRDLYVEYNVDPETENERKARGGSVAPEEDGGEDEFTMPMMLRQLNVDLKVIGYDRDQQRWAD